MKKFVNILCVFMMLAVAGTASADIRTFINEDGKEDWVYDPNYEDPKMKSAGVHYGMPDSYLKKYFFDATGGSKEEISRLDHILDKFKYDAARQGMSVEDYVVDKLKKIQ